MKRCKHSPNPLVWRTGGGDAMQWFTVASWESVDAVRCHHCGAWLSLGPARDDGEHAEAVAIEIRAAEIAGDVDALSPDPIEEACGLNDIDEDSDLDPNRHYLAGYLASYIENHEEDSNG